ncbi:MAG TPA: EAL domain-containing response regulator [Gammaproteobacteria bacterium]|nr:EAL domain-containing response regulator [Gammaproteobacteria bacterium]
MSDNVNRLLVVDDEPGIVELITAAAHRFDYAVASAGTAADFLGLVDSFRPSLVVLDLHLPDGDGVELLRMLVARGFKAPILLMSGVDERVLAAAYELGLAQGLTMYGALAKPVHLPDLEMKLAAAQTADHALDSADLRRGIAAGEVVPYYQPKASLTERGWIIDGVEALARWQHPRLGVVMPDEFVPLAERSGAIGDLTNSVLASALKQMRAWNDEGLKLTCAVNLPPTLVTDLSFPDRVAALLRQHKLDGSQLALEITETATMQNPTTTMDILTRLRVKRIGLSLDDFGTGYSSLTQLYQMPFNEMKIDKSLVLNVPHSREANTMVGSLIELGHNLGLKICAEGVENRAALDMLAILRCDRCQGFFISRAVPAHDIPSLVSHWNRESPAASFTALPRAAV